MTHAEIPLTRGYTAVIDSEDLQRVKEFARSWQALVLANGLVYAKTVKRFGPRWMNQTKCTYLHALILGRENAEDDLKIDHIDGDGLNCRKVNLRVVTHAINLLNRRGLAIHNTTGVTGVSWHRPRRKWCAEITFQGRKYYLGLFPTIEEAVAARKAKEDELWAQIRSR